MELVIRHIHKLCKRVTNIVVEHLPIPTLAISQSNTSETSEGSTTYPAHIKRMAVVGAVHVNAFKHEISIISSLRYNTLPQLVPALGSLTEGNLQIHGGSQIHLSHQSFSAQLASADFQLGKSLLDDHLQSHSYSRQPSIAS